MSLDFFLLDYAAPKPGVYLDVYFREEPSVQERERDEKRVEHTRANQRNLAEQATEGKGAYQVFCARSLLTCFYFTEGWQQEEYGRKPR